MNKKEATSKQKPVGVSSAPKGLGKGLSALLGDNAAVASMSTSPKGKAELGVSATDAATPTVSGMIGAQNVPIGRVSVSPYQPRIRFDEDNLSDLADSIKQHGVVQPLLVRPKSDNSYELIAGERRWRAAQKAGLHEIPVVVRDADDQMAAEISMIENIQRHDLSVLEEAEGYRRLIDEFEYTQDALAKVIGKSRSHLANTMRLLNLPGQVRKMLSEGVLSAGQARPLVGRDDAVELAQIVKTKSLSARQVEQLVAKADKPKPGQLEKPADIVALERDLAASTGFDIAVNFNPLKEKGVVTIRVSDLRQFDAIIEKLKK